MKSVTEFYAALRQRESSNNYGARNSFGYLGAYQVGEAALIDAGFYYPDGTQRNDWRGTWTPRSGVTTELEFLSNPIAQDRAISYVMAKNWSYIKSFGLTQYVGQTIDGVKITASGMLGGAHLVGVGALRTYLKSGGAIDRVDGNGVSVKQYLILFGDYDVSAETIGDAAKLEDLLRNPNAQRLFCPLPESSPVGLPKGLAKLLFDLFPSAEAQAAPRRDPLALDLNGDGVVSTVGTGAGVHFDHAADSFAELSGWVGPGDGIVVRDLNGNGTIDSGKELFGDQTTLPNGSLASNGFEAIAALDSNGDHRVDSLDEHWAELRVWKDLNSDGVTDAGELLSMEQAGVSFISTSYSAANQTDANGNTVAQRGTFGRSDGGTGTAASLLFDQNSTDTVAYDYVEVPDSIRALPDLEGFGNVHSLRQSMARDASLAASVANLIGSTDYRTLRAQFEAIVLQWTGAAEVAPGSRGANIDGRRLAVLEAFYGQGFMGVGGANPNVNAALLLNDAYTKLVDGLYAQYLPQAQLKAAWDQVELQWDDSTDTLTADFSKALPAVHELLGNQPTAAVQLLYEFAKSAKQFGLDTSAGFAEFKAAFDGSSFSYDKVLQAGLDGLALVIGTDGSESLTLPARGVLYALDGGGTATGSTAADWVFGGAGADTLNGGDGDDLLVGGDGNDVLDGGRGADVLKGGAGDDILGGAAGSYDAGYVSYMGGFATPGAGNTYEGGRGNDTLRGTALADVYIFNLGDGQDTITETEVTGQPSGQVDVLRFGAGISPSDISVGRNGVDLVLAHLNGVDRVTVKNWFTTPGSVQNQVERVEFADGTSWSNIDLTAQALVVTGTAGNDTLYGVGAFNDTLLGGGGNDLLNGGDGGDVLEGGDGNDTLDGGAGADTLRGGAGDDVLGGAAGSYDAGYVSYMGGFVSPGAGNTYEGGLGNDTLRGTALADLYVFNVGDGSDTIVETEVSGQPVGQADVLRFGPDIVPGDISVRRNGTDLVVAHVNGSDRVTIKNWFTTTGSTQNQVERIEFADGTVWASSDLTAQALVLTGTDGNDVFSGAANYVNTISGGAGNDNLTGGTLSDLLRGDAGDDVLNGGDGNDVLEGGDGNDILDGGTGADILRGGAGDDVLGGATAYDSGNNSGTIWPYTKAGNTYEGGTGNDVLRGTVYADLYLFNLGDGQDTLSEVETNGGPAAQVDVLRFGPGISPSDISVSRNGADLVFAHVNGTDKVTVKGWYTTPGSVQYQVERVEFADGTAWSNIDLTAQALVVTGTSGNDTLTGVGAFNDTLLGGAGNDTLNGGDGNDLLEGGDGNDLLDGGTGADVLRGGAGDDVLGGATANDSGNNAGTYWPSAKAGNTYEGGTGNDTLRGTVYSDVYLFNLGDGQDTLTDAEAYGAPAGQVDVLRFGPGISTSDIAVSRNGVDLVLAHVNGADRVTIKNWYTTVGSVQNQVERVEFADGTTWSNIDLTAQALTVTGTSGNDVLNGVGAFNDTLLGGAGNDTLNGGDGNDVLEGGDGNDTLDGGTGADTLRGGAGDDILGGATANDSGNNAGTYWPSAKAGNTYEGGTGDDTLRGTVYSDLYLFNLGDGQDALSEVETYSGPTGQVDVLRFGAGIAPADIKVSRNGADLVLAHVNGSDKVTIKNWYSTTASSTANQVERVEFADGSSWTSAYLTSVGATLTGSSASDVLTGSTSYANILYGMDGNDTLNGGNSVDTLYGGAGNDLLQGGAGDDDYRYFLGDGVDTINDSAGAADILRMDGLDMSSVHYWKQGNDLCIEAADGQSVLVKNHFLTGNANRIESFYLNGILMSSNDMALMAQPRS